MGGTGVPDGLRQGSPAYALVYGDWVQPVDDPDGPEFTGPAYAVGGGGDGGGGVAVAPKFVGGT
jgi:hypothetical protein